MGRPSLSVGTGGEIFFSKCTRGYRARCFYRDYDGRRREVERTGRTKEAAKKALRDALRDRIHAGKDDDINADTKFSLVAEKWYASLDETEKSPLTLENYRARLDRQVVPDLGGLRCREITVGVIDRFLRTVTDKHGPGTAKSTRSVVSGVCGLAVRHDALDRNPVRDAGRIQRTTPKRQPRSLELAEARQLLSYMTYHDRSAARDLFDLVMFMLATGMRIGEVSAVVWDALDLDAGTVEVRGTTVRIRKVGLRIKPSPKSPAGWRKLQLPAWCCEMLRLREKALGRGGSVQLINGEGWDSGPAFSAPKGGLRDPSNTQADLRELFDFCGAVDLTSHALRKTVATLMERAGLSALNAADQLGHSKPSMTSDTYFGRYQLKDTGAAIVLAALFD